MMRLPFFGRSNSGENPKRVKLVRAGASGPIAVDFGRRSVRLLQLAKLDAAYRCVAAAELPGWIIGSAETQRESGSSDISARLHEVIAQCGFTGPLCALTLPAEVFQCDTARLPVMPDSELVQSVQFEATDRFGVNIATTLLGHVRLGEAAAGHQDVLIMAMPRAAVEAAVGPVIAASLGALHLEHASFAALRAIARQRDFEIPDPKQAANFALLHIEDRVATFIIVRERVPTMVRSVVGDWAPTNTTLRPATVAAPSADAAHEAALAQAAADDPIAVELDPDPGDTNTQTSWRWCTLAEEALRCLRHLERSQNNWAPAAIVVTGPAACDPQVVASVESVCGVRAELAVPIRLLDSPLPCVHGNPWVSTIGSAISHLPMLTAAPGAAAAPGAPPPPALTKVGYAPRTRIIPAARSVEPTKIRGGAS